MKINWIVAREGEYTTSNACYLLQSLRRGMAVIDSMFNTDYSLALVAKREERDTESDRGGSSVPSAPKGGTSKRRRQRRA